MAVAPTALRSSSAAAADGDGGRSSVRTKLVDNLDVTDLGGLLVDWFDDYFSELVTYSVCSNKQTNRQTLVINISATYSIYYYYIHGCFAD